MCDSMDSLSLSFSNASRPIQQQIPKIVHYVWVNKEPAPLPIFAYVSVEATLEVVKPDAIYFHAHTQPIGEWWERIKDSVTLKVIAQIPTSIFGRPIEVREHVADVVRLEVIREYGGIYMDLDIIPLKSFDSYLQNDMVLGEENKNLLCNALIMAKSNSFFLQKWYESYVSFDDKDWNGHSVVMPGRLANTYPDQIYVVPKKNLFDPDYSQVKELFESVIDVSDNIAIHLWNHAARKYTSSLSEEHIMTYDSTFNLIARRYFTKKKTSFSVNIL